MTFGDELRRTLSFSLKWKGRGFHKVSNQQNALLRLTCYGQGPILPLCWAAGNALRPGKDWAAKWRKKELRKLGHETVRTGSVYFS